LIGGFIQHRKPGSQGQVTQLKGFAGKDCELFWNTGATQLRIWECGLRNSQVVFELRLCIFNPKPGTRPKGGSPKDKEPARRVGVRRTNPRSPIRNVMTPADCRNTGKTIQAPSGGSPKPGPLGPHSFLLRQPDITGYIPLQVNALYEIPWPQ
jgi:hypothetical protein